MTSANYVASAWTDSSRRFSALEQYVTDSYGALGSDPSLRTRELLYESWILLTYAACEASLDGAGKAVMRFLGARYATPARLPDAIMDRHSRYTIEYVSEIYKGSFRGDAGKILSCMNGRLWHEESRLLFLRGNVWSKNVRSWMNRLSDCGDRLEWMKSPVHESETYESRLDGLVRERNQIAHGASGGKTVQDAVMQDLIGDCRGFFEKAHMALMEILQDALSLRTPRLGEVDGSVRLGAKTLPLVNLRKEVSVGDLLLLKGRGQRARAVRVTSLQSGGRSQESFPIGAEKVAVGLSRDHGGGRIYLSP